MSLWLNAEDLTKLDSNSLLLPFHLTTALIMAQGTVKLSKNKSTSGGRAKAQPKRGTRVIAPKKAHAIGDASRIKKYSQSQNGKMESKLASLAGNAGAKLKILKQESTIGDKERAAELAKNEKKRRK